MSLVRSVRGSIYDDVKVTKIDGNFTAIAFSRSIWKPTQKSFKRKYDLVNEVFEVSTKVKSDDRNKLARNCAKLNEILPCFDRTPKVSSQLSSFIQSLSWSTNVYIKLSFSE